MPLKAERTRASYSKANRITYNLKHARELANDKNPLISEIGKHILRTAFGIKFPEEKKKHR